MDVGKEGHTMIRKISEILAEKRPALSFEIYPPKTQRGVVELYKTVETLSALAPDYISVTYRAGGGSEKTTLDIATEIQRRFGITVMHHLTIVNQTRAALVEIIKRIRDRGIVNVLALRGDPPAEMGGAFRKVEGGLEYSYELVDLIREIGGKQFSIGVAGFPEGHVNCPSKELDSRYLAMKVAHGADFVVTQLFFDNRIYSEYLARTRDEGVAAPIVPGVLPITDYNKLLTFCDTCGAYICDEVHRTFKPIAADLEATAAKGAGYATRQCEDLLLRGAPGIHFYCLNKVEPVRTIWMYLKAFVVAKAA